MKDIYLHLRDRNLCKTLAEFTAEWLCAGKDYLAQRKFRGQPVAVDVAFNVYTRLLMHGQHDLAAKVHAHMVEIAMAGMKPIKKPPQRQISSPKPLVGGDVFAVDRSLADEWRAWLKTPKDRDGRVIADNQFRTATEESL